MSTIAKIKQDLNIEAFELSFLKDEKGERQIDPTTNEPTKWAKHWDNTGRQAVLMHEDTFNAIKADPNKGGLGLKTSQKTGPKGDYTMHIIVTYTAPDLGTV